MPKDNQTIAVILAAGKGTRMKSDLPKVLHPLLGKPMVSFVTCACKKAGVLRTLLVVGYRADLVRDTLGPGYEYVAQEEQLGTGHAMMIASEKLKGFTGNVLVLVGDAPFLTGDVLKKLLRHHAKTGASATLMTALMDPPPAYGRILRDDRGRVIRIVEERDATPEEKKITEVNTSHYCFDAGDLLPLLPSLTNHNDQKEYYLTDVISMLAAAGKRVESMTIEDPNILRGINSRRELSEAAALLGQGILLHWLDHSVSIPDPSKVVIEPDVRIGKDTQILPFSLLSGRTVIGPNCIIGPHVHISDSTVKEGARVSFASVESRTVGAGETIGPLASLSGRIPEQESL